MSKNHFAKSPENSGVYADLQDLLQFRLLAKDLNLSKQRKILSSLSGLHSSSFRGRGVDFSEVRAYQSGDDIGSIDWRVTARTGKPHTKLYAEERERPALIILDQSQSMFFGSRVAFKSLRAAQTSALLSWAALARGDRVGGIIFSDLKLDEIRPRRSYKNVLQLIDKTLYFNHSLNKLLLHSKAGNMLSKSLNHARRTTKPGSELFIISDFSDFDETSQQHLYQLSRHNDLVCIMIYDQLEKQIPVPGQFTVTDGQRRTRVNLQDKHTRDAYESLFSNRIEHLQSYLDQLKIPLLQVDTDQLPLEALQQGLGIRGRKR